MTADRMDKNGNWIRTYYPGFTGVPVGVQHIADEATGDALCSPGDKFLPAAVGPGGIIMCPGCRLVHAGWRKT